MRTICYVDGFNLYGYIRFVMSDAPVVGADVKWLHIGKLLERMLLSRHNIVKIKYFTAKIFSSEKNPRRTERQRQYWQALETIPSLSVVYGKFKYVQKKGWFYKLLTKDSNNREHHLTPEDTMLIKKREEKESDVNIATHMMYDCCKSGIDCVVLLSNDTDLKLPLQFARYHFGKWVGVLSPALEAQKDLKKIANFDKTISKDDLVSCQFKTPLYAANGDEIENPWL